MRKLCLAIGCLTLMQTSAFALLFNNNLTDSGASVTATERVDRKFTATISAYNPIPYDPNETAFDQNIIWTKGKETIICKLIPPSRKTFNDRFLSITLGTSGCTPTSK